MFGLFKLKQADAGDKPGIKSKKHPADCSTDEERKKKEKQRKYEANRKPLEDREDLKARIKKWCKESEANGKNWDWLVLHDEELKLQCKICIEVYGIPKLLEGQVPEKKKHVLAWIYKHSEKCGNRSLTQ